jgi:hypothetical protein
MKKKLVSKRAFSLCIILAMLVLLVFPTTILAEGEEPPAEEAPAAEEQAPPAEEPPVEEVVEEEPAEEVAVEEPVEEAAVEVPAEEPAEEAPAEEAQAVEEAVGEAPAEEEAAVEEEAVAEAVELLAEEEIVIADDSGESVPLASTEAAEVLAVPDPMYCPPGEVYGGPTCGPARATMAEAIADAAGAGGTIFVEAGTFDGFTLTGFNGEELVIEGGAGGGTTTFDSQIYLTGNLANITLRNFTAHGENDAGKNTDGEDYVAGDNTPTILALNNSGVLSFEHLDVDHWADSAIYVDDHYGTVKMDDVSAEGGDNDPGAYVDNTVGFGDVIITDSDFWSDEDDGLKVKSAGHVMLDHVTANKSGDDGADINNSYGTGNVSIYNSVFNKNDDYGLKVVSSGWILLDHVTANDNYSIGAYLRTSGEKVIVQNSEFNDTCVWRYNWEYKCTRWRRGACVRGYWYKDWWCDDDHCDNHSQNIGLKIVNENEEKHNTTLCNVVAKYNDNWQIWLESPTGDELSDFVYNLCNIDTKSDGCGKEIRIEGGYNWEEGTGQYEQVCSEGKYGWGLFHGMGCYEHCCILGCWDWIGDSQDGEEIMETASNITVNYKNVKGDFSTENEVDFNKYYCGYPCDDCGEPFCGDGFLSPGEECDPGNGEDIPATHEGCTQECTFIDDMVEVDLDPYCVFVDGAWRMQWVINNPNAFAVNVNWGISDGQMGSASLAPGENNITTTELGKWTMNVDWPGGTDSLTHKITNCGGGSTVTTPPVAFIDQIIPVTGFDLGNGIVLSRQLILTLASAALGSGFLAIGLRKKKKDK